MPVPTDLHLYTNGPIAIGTASSTCPAVTNTIWHNWVDAGTTTHPDQKVLASVYPLTQTWNQWIEVANSTSATTGQWGAAPVANVHQPVFQARIVSTLAREETEAAERRAAEVRRQANEAAARRKLVNARANGNAERLLRSLLNPLQREQLETQRRFFVIGQDGNRYEVSTQKNHENVWLVDEEGNRKERYCIYLSGGSPMADNHAAQLLMLKNEIEKFKEIANIRVLESA